MTDELKQLAAEHAPNFVTSAYSLGVEEVKPRLEAFGREVQRQTVEATAWSPYLTGPTSGGCCVHCKHYMTTRADILTVHRHSIDCPIRSLLSPAQEVRNG